MAPLFYLRTLTTLSVLSIGLQIHSQANLTSAGNTFTNYENLEVEVGELKVRATGKNTTEVLMNLMKNAADWGTMPSSDEKFYPYINLKEELIMKKPVSFLFRES